MKDHATVYTVPHGAEGLERVYGTFDDCRILGVPCTINVGMTPDGNSDCTDAFGFHGMFRRGCMAIHVSGRNQDGSHAQPGFIRALGHYEVVWPPHVTHPPAGFGCRKPEYGVIVSDDPGYGWQHHSKFAPCSSFFTLLGVWCCTVVDEPFTVPGLLADADRRLKRRSPMLLDEKPHTVALRRLLETVLRVTNHNLGVGAMLKRSGRWGYVWEVAR